MNQDLLVSVVDNLQTFVELKMQNLLIYSWIQIKKHSKSSPPSFHFRSRSYGDALKPRHMYLQPGKNNYTTQETTKPPQLYSKDVHIIKTQKYSNQPDNFNRNDELFQTFNQFKDAKQFAFQESETYQYEPSHKINFDTNYYEDAQEVDQFEDIVLDRLSKLEENINKLMTEKKSKQEKRGLVGNLFEYKPYEASYDEQLQEKNEDELVQSPIAEEKINKIPMPPYEYWQASPIKGGKTDLIYNLKYIPMINQDSVNIFKIRELIDASHRQDQNQCVGNSDAEKNKFNKPKITTGTFNNTGGKQFINDEKSGDPSRQKGSSSLYFNRYEGNRNIKNRNQVHFVPKNIEMQTVIQPRTKYTRINSNKNLQNKYRQKNNIKKQPKLLLNGKISGASNSSSNSYFSSRSEAAKNRSTLY